MSRQEKFGAPPLEASQEPPSFDCTILQDLRDRLDQTVDLIDDELRRRQKPGPGPKQLCRLASHIYQARRTRDRYLNRELLGEPAWDMLLALYFMPMRGELLTVSSLCHASAVPQTTALRWQQLLIEAKLIERGPSLDGDRRRILLRLTENGRILMDRYLTRLYYSDLPRPPDYPVENAK